MLSSLSSPFTGLRGFQPPVPRRRQQGAMRVAMRDRGKNRKPLQKGRHLSIEAIQAVQALKRASSGPAPADAVDRVVRQKVRRLLKIDLMAVLEELQRQNEGELALQVFEEVRREQWYKPQLSVYADMVRVLANSNLLHKMEVIVSYLKDESFKDDTLGANALLQCFLEFGFTNIAMDCYRMLKSWETEPDKSTFMILISGMASNGDFTLSDTVRDDAKEYFGGYLDFLEEANEMQELKCKYFSGFTWKLAPPKLSR